MVIGLVSQGHTLLPEHPAALPVDVQASLDGIGGRLFPEDAAHVAEHLKDTAGGIRIGYHPLCLYLLVVCGLLLWVVSPLRNGRPRRRCARSVSYTHLTLPTIYSV